MSNNILLPVTFFYDVAELVVRLHSEDFYNAYIISLCSSLKSQISAKLDALDRHDAFSKYKSAAPLSVEREIFRQVYLDLTGVHKHWVSHRESPL